jgi:hypothetical protein
MPRPDSEKYELSPAEKRDLVKLIEQGKPLPEKYPPILVAPNVSSLPVRCGFLLHECILLATAIIRQTGE